MLLGNVNYNPNTKAKYIDQSMDSKNTWDTATSWNKWTYEPREIINKIQEWAKRM